MIAASVSLPADHAAARPQVGLVRRSLGFALDLLILTKYRISAVALFTGYAAIAIHGTYATDWNHIWPLLLAMFCAGGSANTLNQVFERGYDAVMTRTRHRRPLPDGRVQPWQAVVWAVVLLLAAVAINLWIYHSPLGAWLSVGLVLYYSFFYTLWLKRRHHLNIVIGGVPGAMGPLLAWAGLTGTLTAAPIAMFLIIFMWTPPHVWALAIRIRDDYARAGIPMLPVVKGIDETTRQIFFYTVALVAITIALPFLDAAFRRGWAYPGLALVLGGVFLLWAWRLWRRRPVMPTMPLFRFTIAYLCSLFAGLTIDGLMSR